MFQVCKNNYKQRQI